MVDEDKKIPDRAIPPAPCTYVRLESKSVTHDRWRSDFKLKQGGFVNPFPVNGIK
jgi:hypothetical protein